MLILVFIQGQRQKNKRTHYFYQLWPGPAPAYFIVLHVSLHEKKYFRPLKALRLQVVDLCLWLIADGCIVAPGCFLVVAHRILVGEHPSHRDDLVEIKHPATTRQILPTDLESEPQSFLGNFSTSFWLVTEIAALFLNELLGCDEVNATSTRIPRHHCTTG